MLSAFLVLQRALEKTGQLSGARLARQRSSPADQSGRIPHPKNFQRELCLVQPLQRAGVGGRMAWKVPHSFS